MKVCFDQEVGGGAHVTKANTNCRQMFRIEVLGDFLEKTLNGVVPYLIKIDIEGYELLALKEATTYFEKYGKPKYIFAEFNVQWIKNMGLDPVKVMSWYWSLGYKCYHNTTPFDGKIDDRDLVDGTKALTPDNMVCL